MSNWSWPPAASTSTSSSSSSAFSSCSSFSCAFSSSFGSSVASALSSMESMSNCSFRRPPALAFAAAGAWSAGVSAAASTPADGGGAPFVSCQASFCSCACALAFLAFFLASSAFTAASSSALIRSLSSASRWTLSASSRFFCARSAFSAFTCRKRLRMTMAFPSSSLLSLVAMPLLLTMPFSLSCGTTRTGSGSGWRSALTTSLRPAATAIASKDRPLASFFLGSAL
mmetsp:Transcript_22312/g.50257  ORF Transcript_22312/g.50257 Transcript_22312/m.50257 type:complete len:228 (-) Transcript_22312:59-742(-)